MSDWKRWRRDGDARLWWSLWLRITCSWFVIGWHCWRKGHDYREQSASMCVRVTACAWCGKYRGSRRTGQTCTQPRWNA